MSSILHLLLVSLILSFSTSLAFAADPYIAVGSARARKAVVALPPILVKAGITQKGTPGAKGGPDSKELAQVISETITADLNFMDLFRFLDPSAFIENPRTAGLTPDLFKFQDWKSIGTEFLIKAQVVREYGTMTLEAYLYDVNGTKQILAKRYVATLNDAKLLAHTFANDIVYAMTGLPGIFLTKIAMSCDRGGKTKEIYTMNFDGTDVKQITSHRSISFSPAWSPDAAKLAYSRISKRVSNNVKNIDLYEFDFRSNTVRLLSNRTGINSGANYSPDGKKIAMTMSFLGNPEVFSLDPVTKTVTRLTHSMGFDVDPAYSPDGKQLAFVSSRTGMPMVFRMNINGTGIQRLTYAGRYNATPTWSPTGNKLGFAGWIDGTFDIFIMNPDGTNIERLTKSQGNNEDPHISPDGNFVVFSSNRTGQKNIYVMNIDGTFAKRLTYGLGNCVSPKWSPIPPKPSAGK